jgi:hypothetical protein
MNNSTLRNAALFIATTTLTLLTACSPNPSPPKTFDWKEEIQLHDGRKIIAERLDTLGGWAEPGQEGAPQLRRITFPDPNQSGKTYTHTITGSSNYLLLDFDKGQPWLIVEIGPFSTDSKCPIGTYETFTMREGKWQSVSYAGLPRQFLKPNMALSYTNSMREKGQLTSSSQIMQRINDSRYTALESAWNLVQTNVHGRPIDCDHYRKLAQEMKQ